MKEMPAIIKHFDKYPLITKKWADYQLFKQAFSLIQDKKHLTFLGLKKLVALKASINWGLPSQLKAKFADIEAVSREEVVNNEIPDPDWLAGFSSAEGSFLVRVFSSSNHRTGYQVLLRFQITQLSRD